MYRLDIKSDEVAKILGLNQSTARRHLRTLRNSCNKTKHQVITIAEFCIFYDLSYKIIFCQINKLKNQDYDKKVEEGHIIIPKEVAINQATY